jgi:hypothetical protein
MLACADILLKTNYYLVLNQNAPLLIIKSLHQNSQLNKRQIKLLRNEKLCKN